MLVKCKNREIKVDNLRQKLQKQVVHQLQSRENKD